MTSRTAARPIEFIGSEETLRSIPIEERLTIANMTTEWGALPGCGVNFYMAAASIPERQIAEEAGDWQVLIDAGAQPLPAGCGHRSAGAWRASPEVVAASALKGRIGGPGWYQKPDGVEKVILGEGSGDMAADTAASVGDALDRIIAEAESMIAGAEKDLGGETAAEHAPKQADETLTDMLPGFTEKIEGDIVFCDADNINTDGIYAGNVARAGDVLKISLVVAGSFGNIFSRNSINNALMGIEVWPVSSAACERPPPLGAAAMSPPAALAGPSSGTFAAARSSSPRARAGRRGARASARCPPMCRKLLPEGGWRIGSRLRLPRPK
ncbi:hypothetical protein G6O67_006740 [Ophiocordyceps sinensis]|uniref:Uncharacterized protein n=1 Tax=Ophiocordyceps sinensis TaxID=72228 RepID=A0A8H4PP82_9HYPO|nr:hypothetical protein G6O67_006740 [Ophiocordyceps sinensis]